MVCDSAQKIILRACQQHRKLHICYSGLESATVSTAASLISVLDSFCQSVKDVMKSSEALHAFSGVSHITGTEFAKNPWYPWTFGKAHKSDSGIFSERHLKFRALSCMRKEMLDLGTDSTNTKIINLYRHELTCPPLLKDIDILTSLHFQVKSTEHVCDIIFRMVEPCPELLPSQFPIIITLILYSNFILHILK